MKAETRAEIGQTWEASLAGVSLLFLIVSRSAEGELTMLCLEEDAAPVQIPAFKIEAGHDALARWRRVL